MVASKMPAAEIDVTPHLVRSLLEIQHPDLAGLDITLVANGWDNVLYRLGSELMARLPRRRVSATLVEHEVRWLPELAPRLPVPVPTPVRVGEPTTLYPWKWTIVPWFEGDSIGSDPLDDAVGMARDLGAFVAALHQTAPAGYPRNPFRGVPLAGRDEMTRARLVALDGQIEHQSQVEEAWDAALEAPAWESEPMWLHGDLHPANIIVRGGTLAAVVDFGDITAGDPATDLLVAWSLFDAEHRALFRHAADSSSRPIDDAMWARGRGWGVAHGLALMASSADNPAMRAIAKRTLEAVVDG